jgi:hypothetical protein
MNSANEKLNVQDAEAVCEVLDAAAKINHEHPLRNGSVIELPDKGKLTITGDLHDHRENLRKIIRLAELAKPDRHLIMQETVHSERLISGKDLSYRTLVEVAQLIVRHPQQVFVLQSNHELAQVNGEDIAKYGISLIEAFNDGVEYMFGEDADYVFQALDRYVRSLPLAVRCANGVLAAHSLPSPTRRNVFDPMVLSRELTEDDLSSPTGSAYLLVWGRNLTQEWADDLAAVWGVKQFVLGHQPAEMGYEMCGETMLILASDHEHGVVLPIDLAAEYDRDALMDQVIPLAAVRS